MVTAKFEQAAKTEVYVFLKAPSFTLHLSDLQTLFHDCLEKLRIPARLKILRSCGDSANRDISVGFSMT